VRTFIAVDFPPVILGKIEAIVDYFKKKVPDHALKWVDTDNLHLTIKFIGEIDPGKLEQVKSILTRCLEYQNAFEIEVAGLGMYPNQRAPRVIWLGITGGDPLGRIHATLDRHLSELGIKPEGRAFTPHLTIARIRKGTDRKTAQAIGETLAQFKVDSLGTVTIDRVHLYQSVLTPSGPIYTNLFAAMLNQV
jgi:2'-5' RNA ligase